MSRSGQRAVGYGAPGIRIDGNDVLEVYGTTRLVVVRARTGNGPTLIECVTMRMRGHSEQDSASCVPRQVLEEWTRKDPIERFERGFIDGGIIESHALEEVRTDVHGQVALAAGWAAADARARLHL